MRKILHFIESTLGIYRWHPTIALRYLPVVDMIERMNIREVLEVGSGGLGIAPYINRSVIGLDIEFAPLVHPLLVGVKGSATKIPFADKSFACVISMDMLEHISPSKRKQAIAEMLRVGKKLVIIGVPCGKLSAQHDKKLNDRYKKMHKKEFKFLTEQVEYGLPDKQEIISFIRKSADKLNLKYKHNVYGNMNIQLRKFLMWGWMSDNILINIIFRKLFLLLIPVLRNYNHEPTYRQVFVVEMGD